MALEMYQDAILTVDLSEHGLCKGLDKDVCYPRSDSKELANQP